LNLSEDLQIEYYGVRGEVNMAFLKSDFYKNLLVTTPQEIELKKKMKFRSASLKSLHSNPNEK
jgi:hypothetical protein